MSTIIAHESPDDPITGGYRYMRNFLSSDVGSELDEEFMPTPTIRNLKRDFLTYSSDNEDERFAASPISARRKRMDNKLRLPNSESLLGSHKQNMDPNGVLGEVRMLIAKAVEEGEDVISLEYALTAHKTMLIY